MAGGERPWRKSAEIPFHDAQHRLHFKKKAMKSPAANKQKRTRVAESVQTTKWMQTRDRSKATKNKQQKKSNETRRVGVIRKMSADRHRQ